METLTVKECALLRERLVAQFHTYARDRQHAVARGLETAALAGLQVQKYGYGMVAALEILDAVLDTRLREALDVDAATARVDPAWVAHMHARWQAQADLDLSRPRPRVPPVPPHAAGARGGAQEPSGA